MPKRKIKTEKEGQIFRTEQTELSDQKPIKQVDTKWVQFSSKYHGFPNEDPQPGGGLSWTGSNIIDDIRDQIAQGHNDTCNC